MSKPILCLDFDGVIHSYSSGWQGADLVSDEPVPGAIEWIWQAIVAGWNVQIFSSRSSTPGGIPAMQHWLHGAVNNWLSREPEKMWRETSSECVAMYMMEISWPKEKPPAFLTIDDRALCFDGDWGKFDPDKLFAFKPWNKK